MFTQSKIITSSAFSPPVVTPRGQNSPSNSRPHLQVLIPESLTQPQRLLRHRPRVPWRRLRQDAREEIQRQDVRPGARNNGVRVQRCPKKHARKTWKSLNNNYLSIIVRYDDVCEFKWLNNWKKEVQWFGQWFTTWKCKTWEPCKISWLKEQKMCFFRKSSGYTLKTESNRFLEIMFPFPRAKKLSECRFLDQTQLQGGVLMCDKSNKKATKRERLADLQIHYRFNRMF